jgi:hypothetical protein
MKIDYSAVSTEELRKFGFIFAGILIFLFGLLIPYWRHHEIRVWPFYIGMPVALLAAVWPTALRPFYVVWMKFGAVMGFINTRIIMSVFFFVMITPLAWIFKLLGKDPMARALEKSANTYRVVSKPYAKEEMEKPY